MDLRLLKKAFVRWWWLGLIPVLIVAMVLGISYQKPPTPYRVTLRFATGGLPSESLSDDYDRYYAWLSSEYIANGLADIATSDSFANQIGHRLQENGVEISPAAIRDFHMSLSVPIRQVLGQVRASRREHAELFAFLEALLTYHVPGFDQAPLKGLRFLDLESTRLLRAASPR